MERAEQEAVQAAGKVQSVFGPRLDALVRPGKLSAGQVEGLIRSLREATGGATLPPTPSEADADVGHLSTLALRGGAAAGRGSGPASDLARSKTVHRDPALAPTSHAEGRFPVENWDRYEFLKLLGQGGMGAVYKARDRRLG